MRTAVKARPILAAAIVAMGLGVAFTFLRALTHVGGQSLDTFTDSWVYTAVEAIAVPVCAMRAVRRRQDRLAWSLMAVGLATWSVGDLLWTVWLDWLANPPYPSIADAAYLLMYPAVYASLMLLIRSRLPNAGAAQWLDGGVVAFTLAAIAAAIVFSSVLATTHGHFVAEAVNVAYPVGDFMLLMFVACAFSLANWRPGRMWLFIGVGVSLSAGADIVFVYQVAQGGNVTSELTNGMYLLSMFLLSTAAWAPDRRRAAVGGEAPQTIILTAIAAACALGLLVAAAFVHITALAVLLAAGALGLGCVRATLTYLENVRMMRRSGREAVTDVLSGLGNRRLLMTDLDEALRAAAHGHSSTLVFFDLNGFKRYNDNFGHGTGDALLARIGASLRDAVGARGTAYRLGGDEFCALLDGRFAADGEFVATIAGALVERGQGFTVDTCFGVATIPDDGTTASAVLQLADKRMYASKACVSRAQARDVLIQLLNERTPGLLEHSSNVTRLVQGVAADLGIEGEALDALLRAAELHDIGKLAIPDDVVNKPGLLDETELEFMRQHPEIGERILCAAPSLAHVAPLVRSSHERWDGLGYPDRIAGEQIPLGARIVAACDAYDAMISDRCYRAARTRADAVAELRRHSGTQFDPAVVASLIRVLASERAGSDAGKQHIKRAA